MGAANIRLTKALLPPSKATAVPMCRPARRAANRAVLRRSDSRRRLDGATANTLKGALDQGAGHFRADGRKWPPVPHLTGWARRAPSVVQRNGRRRCAPVHGCLRREPAGDAADKSRPEPGMEGRY